VIADPTRRRILDTLRDGATAVDTLVARLDISQPLVSKHLAVLRDAGAVDVTVVGKRRVYRLSDRARCGRNRSTCSTPWPAA
jgi:DNA-binding transcriptional ArsR family regulator